MRRTARETIYYYFTNRKSRLGKLIEIVMLSLTLVLCLLFVLESYLPNQRELLFTIDSAVVSLLIVEFILRIYSAPNRIKHLKTPYNIIDFLSILPTVLQWFFPATSLGFLTTIRILRLFRVIRFLRFLESTDLFFGTVAEGALRLIRMSATIGILFFISAGVMVSIEAPFNSKMNTFGDAFYFAVSTLTTVGFGDITPITPQGRFATVLMIIAGIIIIPWQASRVMRGYGKNHVTCKSCGLSYHDHDASHCKQCGAVIFQEDKPV